MRLAITLITAGKCDRRNRARWSILRSSNSELRMSLEGQNLRLPQRNIGIRFNPISRHYGRPDCRQPPIFYTRVHANASACSAGWFHCAVPPDIAPRPPSGEQWLHEIKHDGFRIIARKDGKRVKLYSRPGNDLTYQFPLIVEAIAKLRSRSCIIDGEAVACGEDGIASFDRIRYRHHDDGRFPVGLRPDRTRRR